MDSPTPSCVSMKSDRSMELPLHFKGQCSSETKSEKGESTDSPPPSCVSMKSDRSMELPLHFKGQCSSETKVQEYSKDPKLEQSTNLDSIFMILKDNIVNFVMDELKNFQHLLSQDPETLKSQKKTEEVDGEDKVQKRKFTEAVLNITLHYMRKIKQEELADRLLNRTSSGLCQRKLKLHRKKKFRCVFEGIAKAGNSTFLNEIYTELYITEGESSEVNDEHEVIQIEAASRKTDELEKKIKCENIFNAEMTACRNEPIRTVMTKGVAGIGKTVLTQKFTLDWAEDKANQDIHFIFPFTFRELNVVKEKKFSLVELVHHFFTETKEAGICSFEDFQVVFIFDGLDECRLPLDFHNTKILTDVTESTSVNVLLTNLIRGKLLPSARLWITTRPAAASQIPPECVDMVTEVRGFTNPQKEEYFRKRFRDEEQASTIISHIKTSRSLHIMCHIPVFCWITATVLEDELKTREGGELPKTLTEMYIHFLVVQTKEKKVKYDGGSETDPHWSPESRKMIESLGKLAFDQLQKGNLIFYESDLTEYSIDTTAASVYSGMFTQIFKEERGLYQSKVFCFVHLSVQEFLAALHVHMKFINHGVNLLEKSQKSSLWCRWFDKLDLGHLHQCAVVKALQSPNGHLDLFLRFLLGLSVQTSQNLLHGLVKERRNRQNTTINTVKYIKKKISEDLPTERSLNLFHCLNELKVKSLTDKVQCLMSSGRLSERKLSPAQWSALAFILLSSEEDLDVFNLKIFFPSNDVLLRMLQVIKSSRRAL
ncbi:protein NLRC3-like [Mugil cephalus]|uniref:protein NLRC3-like n=1 Tax=Mugil cephalus TaxID=48193 RepID=UPI001FB7CBF6|nr:protein NLRC3-like [Mugil cephalus]